MKKRKPASALQTAANRANGNCSKGPKDTSKTRFNAATHGQKAKLPFLMGERKEDWDNLLKWVLSEHEPFTAEQKQICFEMAKVHWREMRLDRFETSFINYEVRCVVMDRIKPVEHAAYSIGDERIRATSEVNQILVDEADQLIPTDMDIEIAYRRIQEHHGEMCYKQHKMSYQNSRLLRDLLADLHRLKKDQARQSPNEREDRSVIQPENLNKAFMVQAPVRRDSKVLLAATGDKVAAEKGKTAQVTQPPTEPTSQPKRQPSKSLSRPAKSNRSPLGSRKLGSSISTTGDARPKPQLSTLAPADETRTGAGARVTDSGVGAESEIWSEEWHKQRRRQPE